jgi:hypothetical protein
LFAYSLISEESLLAFPEYDIFLITTFPDASFTAMMPLFLSMLNEYPAVASVQRPPLVLTSALTGSQSVLTMP